MHEGQLTDVDWYLYQIKNAPDQAKLDDLAIAIDYDKWEKHSYTQDEESMQRIRDAWGQRRSELRRVA
jgi:hypothetical protein